MASSDRPLEKSPLNFVLKCHHEVMPSNQGLTDTVVLIMGETPFKVSGKSTGMVFLSDPALRHDQCKPQKDMKEAA